MMNRIILSMICYILISTTSFSQNYKWQKIFVEPTAAQLRFMSVCCADSMHCVAIGNYQLTKPVIKATSDGGKTWITVMTDTSSEIPSYIPRRVCDVSYPDTNLCLITADSGKFWRSTDGLRTWTRGNLYDNYNKRHVFEYLTHFSGKLKGGIKHPGKIVHLTSDGGETWFEPKLNLPDSLLPTSNDDIQIITENSVIILSNNYFKLDYILRSNDFGQNWVAYEQTPRRIRALKFLDSLEGWGVGGVQVDSTGICRDIILHTIDGGKSWEIQVDSMPRKKTGLYCVDFYDKLHGLAIGAWNNVWVTEDGGKNWVFDPWFDDNYPAAILTNIGWLNSQSYIAVTYDNELYKYTKEPVSVSEIVEENILFISPNPATDYIEISINKGLQPLVQNMQVMIYNVFGEEIPPRLTASGTTQEGNLENSSSQYSLLTTQYSAKIDVSGLPPGVYFVRAGGRVGRFLKI